MSTGKGSVASALSSEQVTALDSVSSEVFDEWIQRLRDRLGPSAGERLRQLTEDQKKGRDLPAVMSRLLRRRQPHGTEDVQVLLEHVRRREYSISDLFVDLCCLEEAIEATVRAHCAKDRVDVAGLMHGVRARFMSVFEFVLKETSDIHERLAERGPAYCQVDAAGAIVYANEKMRCMLGVERASGLSLPDFFGDDAAAIREVAQGMHGHEPLVRQFCLTPASGGRVYVCGEIAPVIVDGRSRGAYATLTDMSAVTELHNRIFEMSRLGIVRVDWNLSFTYANPAALAMFGVKSLDQLDIRSLVSDPESWARLKSEFRLRRQGQSGEYDINITRVDDGRMVPVSITAMPELDSAGDMIGALSIIRSLELERSTKLLHKHLKDCDNWKELLAEVAGDVAQIIPHDLFLVSVYTPKGTFSRVIFEYPEREGFAWPKRWFAVSEALSAWMAEQGTKPVGSLPDLYEDPRLKPIVEREKVADLIIERGIQSFIRYPVMRAQGASAVMLMSKQRDAFADAEERLKALPMAEVLNTVMHYRMVEEQQFRFQLMKDIANSPDVDTVMETLVRSLLKHYQWQDIGVFRVDDVGACFRLQAEAHSAEGYSYQPSFTQPLDQGVLGHVYRTGVAARIDNVQDHPEFIESRGQVLSELCIPIRMSDGRIRWLLNIEDRVENAFSQEDEDSLEDVVNEVQLILDHLLAHFFLDEFIDRASGAIVVTDAVGRIVRSNSAALSLLGGAKSAEVLGKDFGDFLAPEDRAVLHSGSKRIRSQRRLRRVDGQSRDVLLSGEFHESFGRKVFSVQDLSVLHRLEELETVSDMFHEIAVQTRSPLSLLFAWLRQLHQRAEDASTKDVLDKAIRQLRRVELTYERLVLYDTQKGVVPFNPVRLDLASVLRAAKEELPRPDAERIEVNVGQRTPCISGDLFQLVFVFQAILTYLLRYLPVDERLRVVVEAVNDGVGIRIAGFAPIGRPGGVGPNELTAARTHLDIALSESVIRRFIEEKHHGRYTCESLGAGKVEFQIILPANP